MKPATKREVWVSAYLSDGEPQRFPFGSIVAYGSEETAKHHAFNNCEVVRYVPAPPKKRRKR